MGRAALLILVVGCNYTPPEGTIPDGPGSDTGTDTDGPPCTAWTTRGGHIDNVCAKPPVASWRVGGATVVTYNTETEDYSGGAAPASYLFTRQGLTTRVVSVTDFSVDQDTTLRVVGAHPLMVLSASTISISGTLDVSSRRDGGMPSIGAGIGTNSSGCQIARDGQGTAAGGGGGGGGFKITGARGGNGDPNQGGSSQGGNGGGSINRPQLFVIGGCRGGNGGNGASAGGGGAGGGAVQLTAKESITLTSTGQILAGGMGGQGAQMGSGGGGGGGGGGSGGFIGLDAPLVVTMSGSVLAANGGAGGAGCSADTGENGQDGKPANEAAIGGDSASCTNGTRGGNGSVRTTPTPGDGEDADSGDAAGGSGGGGGVGYIIVWAPPQMFMRDGLVTPAEDRVNNVEP